MADYTLQYGSKVYLRCSFTVESIGVTIDPATDYTYETALCAIGTDFDPATATWEDATYATSGGLHYLLTPIGDAQTIDPAEDSKSKVYIRCTPTLASGLFEAPIIEASGMVIVS